MTLSPAIQVAIRVMMYLLVAGSVGISVWAFLARYNQRHMLKSRLRVAREAQAAQSGRPEHQGRSIFTYLLPAEMLARVREGFEARRAVSALPISWRTFVGISVALSVVFGLVGMVYFSNVLASMALGLMGLMLPDQFLATGASVHRDKTHEQLQMAIQTFATEYRTHRIIQRAFLETATQVPEPIRFHFERAARRLNNGEDYHIVLGEFRERVNHPFARIFVANCIACMDNQQAAPLFEAIGYQLNQWRVRMTQNNAALSGGKTVGLLLNGSLPLIYVVNIRMQPDTHAFFTEVSLGRGLLVMMLVGVLLTFGVNKYLAGSDW